MSIAVIISFVILGLSIVLATLMIVVAVKITKD